MDCFDAIVVGSGPGATSAALGLEGKNVLVLDVGYDAPAAPQLSGSLHQLRQTKEDLFSDLIGEGFQSLYNLHNPPISLKLKSPYMSFIVQGAKQLSPIVSRSFEGVISLAKGGLANGWGAGVYRFADQDLAGFPVTSSELKPFYDELTAHIGISGANDLLTPFFGQDDGLLPPLRLSGFFEEFLSTYAKRRSELEHEQVWIGRPRLAVLSAVHRQRSAYQYENFEFFQARNPAIYTPAYTIDELRASGAIDYRDNRLVRKFREVNGIVEVEAQNLSAGRAETWRTRKLCIGAGVLNSARIVLESANDYQTRLPLLDNPMACFPFFAIRRIPKSSSDVDSSLAQLNIVVKDPVSGEALQGSLYGTTGPLRSDILFGLPLAISANVAVTKYLAPAMGLLMMFYPGFEHQESYVRLRPGGQLEVEFARASPRLEAERRVCGVLRRLGYLTHRALIQRPGMGQGLHFAGTLPMQINPGSYQTNRYGLLYGSNNVHVVDGACFPHLPAKNLTFTIMANALRIGRYVASRL